MKKNLCLLSVLIGTLLITRTQAANFYDPCGCGLYAQWQGVYAATSPSGGHHDPIPVGLLDYYGITESNCISVGGVLAVKNGCDGTWSTNIHPTAGQTYTIPCGGGPPTIGAPGTDDGDDDDTDPTPKNEPPDPCGGNSDNSGDDYLDGMPRWHVSEPYISLWLHDKPLGYKPALGPSISVSLSFKQRSYIPGYDPSFFSFGKKWNCSLRSYIKVDGVGNEVVYLSTGAKRNYLGTNIDYVTNTRLTGDSSSGFTLYYPDGRQDVYGFLVHDNSGNLLEACLTQRINADGKGLAYNYHTYSTSAPVVRLKNIVDADGKTNLIFYATNNTYSSNLISQIQDPFGRSAYLYYDSSGHLTNLTDVAGISTSFLYDGNEVVTNMTTPYGATSFLLSDPGASTQDPNGRSARIINPDGGVELFLYTNSAPGVASSYSAGDMPSTATWFTNSFDTNSLNVRNSFHWGSRQYSSLHTTNISSLNSDDFLLARMQHWLQTTNSIPGKTLSLLRAPSPYASSPIEGQKTWYDHAGKTNTQYEGTQSSPLFTAWVLPDGTTHFERQDRNLLGKTLTNITTYSVGGSVALRTNTFVYDATTGIDLIVATNAIGVQVSSNAYNAYHQVVTNYDALNQITTCIYNGSQQIVSITLPSGLVITNIYAADGHLATNYSYAVAGGATNYFGTNVYTYANDLVLTKTDARGLTISNTWDNLQRLVRADYLDGSGTYVTNTYSNLDLIQVVDRMGFTNSYVYDQMRRLTRQTNALGNYTVYSYCTCGGLDSIRDTLGKTNYFYYDNQGRMTNHVSLDGYCATNFYNLLGQLTNKIDSAGVSLTNWFNNQGLTYVASNYLGQVFQITFDKLDRATNSVNANGVAIIKAYDNLNRVLTNTYPDTGYETFAYSFNGVIAYTNQLFKTNLYVYDAAGRKIAETNANGEGVQYTHSAAGDLLTLTDGKGLTTTWQYNSFGLVTNKMDATNNVVQTNGYDANLRLTNRWTPAKLGTTYSYDKVGNLTGIAYHTSPSISFAYDAMNRLTNMIDASGTNRYTYDQVGQILTEDGPWANDTVSYTYNNRLRASLSLQQPNADPWSQTYNFDSARRLTNTISPAGTFGYQYDPTNRLQVKKLTLPKGAYITNAYDSVARLLSTKLKNSGDTNLDAYTYIYNLGGQRTNVTRTGGDFVGYAYDSIGQLTNAIGKELGGATNRLQEQFTYAYDKSHNLSVRTNNALVQMFGVNTLNELTGATLSGTLTVAGTTGASSSSVTVSGTGLSSGAATLYGDNTWARTNATTADGANTYTATASDSLGRSSTDTVTAYLPASPTYTYDANGNLLNDGTRYFVYDDENELVTAYVTNAWKSDFVYDGKMRRRIRKESTWQSSSWVQTNEVHYIYDGNAVIQERDVNNMPNVAYSRGQDMSGSLQAAGGIGGLLAMSQLSVEVPQHFYYHCDGNGNVTALINGLQFIAAKYLYDPFGNLISQVGPLAAANLYRCSSKEFHENSGLVYYLYRYYDPNLQRWLNRDPIAESGGVNLYGFVVNNPANLWDPFGYCDCDALRMALVAAQNARGAYGGASAPGWSPVDTFKDAKTGFGGTLYSNGDSQNPQYMLAFRGTDLSLVDWKNNAQQALGGESYQYNEAVNYTADMKEQYGNNMSTTGHSLGGGLASLASLSSGLPGYTFNASGLSSATMNAKGVSGADASNIAAYHILGEPLSTAQDISGINPATGVRNTLIPTLPLSTTILSQILGPAYLALKLHSIDTVVASLQATIHTKCDN